MKNKRSSIDDAHAVSESVGYIIIFGIMLTGIGLVTLYGYPVLMQEQQNSNIRNMERNMIVLQSDINSLTLKYVPYKETIMQVSGGVLSVESPDPALKWFTIYDNTDSLYLIPTDYSSENKFSPGGLKFLTNSGDVLISLHNGAVVKHQSGGSVMISEPRWFSDEIKVGEDISKSLVILLIQVDTVSFGQHLSQSGIGTVQMSIEPLIIDIPNNDNELEYHFAQPGHQITIEYRDTNFDYKTAWKNYFIHGKLGMTDTGDYAGTMMDIDRVIIKAWKINILNL